MDRCYSYRESLAVENSHMNVAGAVTLGKSSRSEAEYEISKRKQEIKKRHVQSARRVGVRMIGGFLFVTFIFTCATFTIFLIVLIRLTVAVVASCC